MTGNPEGRPKLPCLVCRAPKEEWPTIALKYLFDTGDLCDLHAAMATQKIKDNPIPKEEYKAPPAFLPPIPKRAIKNFQDREPNMGELIE